jgi:hypothetical protein
LHFKSEESPVKPHANGFPQSNLSQVKLEYRTDDRCHHRDVLLGPTQKKILVQ